MDLNFEYSRPRRRYVLRTNLFNVFDSLCCNDSTGATASNSGHITSRSYCAVAASESSKVVKHWLPFGVGRYACGESLYGNSGSQSSACPFSNTAQRSSQRETLILGTACGGSRKRGIINQEGGSTELCSYQSRRVVK